MAHRLLTTLTSWALSASALAAALPTRAALGEPTSFVASDGKALAAVQRGATSRSGYSVHELESGGFVVREFALPSGVVFGVAWHGITQPDLPSLLGSYAAEYEAGRAQASHHHGSRTERVVTEHVVVQEWGHMRRLQGRAYIPALVPQGVSIDDIK